MPQDRQMAIDLIEEAVVAGARRHKACAVLEIAVRTLQRWQKTLQEENTLADHRQARGGRAYAGQQAERGGATRDPGDLPQPGIPKPAAVADRAEIGR